MKKNTTVLEAGINGYDRTVHTKSTRRIIQRGDGRVLCSASLRHIMLYHGPRMPETPEDMSGGNKDYSKTHHEARISQLSVCDGVMELSFFFSYVYFNPSPFQERVRRSRGIISINHPSSGIYIYTCLPDISVLRRRSALVDDSLATRSRVLTR